MNIVDITLIGFIVLVTFCSGCSSDLTVDGSVAADATAGQDAGEISTVKAHDTDQADAVKPECFGMSDCDDGNVCTFDACEKGSCVHAELADKIACDDGDPCTTGICKLGTCYQNSTEGTNGVKGCVLCKKDADCGSPVGYQHYCNGNMQQDEKLLGCIAGVCQWGVGSFVCDAGCDSATGMCKSECLSDKDCDDKIECTADICTSANKCSHIPADNLCWDGSDGSKKFCIIQESGSAQPSGCYECKDGEGLCDDGNSCTDDSCVAGKCEHTPVDTNFLPVGCDADANACTIDYCFDGVCKSDTVGQTKCGECTTDQDCEDYYYEDAQCSQDKKFVYWVESKVCTILASNPTVGYCKVDVVKKLPCPNGCQWPSGNEPFKCE